MEVIIVATAEDVGTTAAAALTALLANDPKAVLGLPTGETPKHLYRTLVAQRTDLSKATTFNLDEYVGEDTYRRYMQAELFDHSPVAGAHIPNGRAADLAAECARYEAAIAAAGGIDLCVLGLGKNGHIAFNEPTSSLRSRTRVKTLMQGKHVITMGVGTIMDARRLLVLAHGPSKASAVAQMIEGPLTAMVPASALQEHPRATAIIDEAAAAQLTMKDYYRAVQAHKPAWQRARDGS
jgi:glucosamine-6-phosphate deaminase